MLTARTLMDDYNEWRNQTHHTQQIRQTGTYVRGYKLTPERRFIFNKMIEFCSSKRVDPRLWLYSLFSARNWLYAPKFDQLFSEKNDDNYRNLKSTSKYQEKIRNELYEQKVADGVTYDPNRDVTASTEGLKRRYIDNHDVDRCLEEMHSRTLGFHPKSLVCARCPVAKKCESMLQAATSFDIMALRRGEITSEQCRNLALRARHARQST